MRGSVAALAAMAVTTVVAQEKACSPLHFIFARATTELPPNVENATPQAFEAAANKFWSKGYGAGGFSMFQNISAVIPGTTGYPVHYPASWSGCTSEDKGVKDMLAELSKQSAACPKQKFILGGHSQGGVVTVRTIPQIPADILAKVLAVTMIGSPNCPTLVKDRCKSYCNLGDGICKAGPPADDMNAKCAGGAGAAAKGSGPPKSPKMGGMSKGGGRTEIARGKRAIEELFKPKDDKPDCSKPEAAEKEYKATFAKGAHLSYNEEGHFMEAAACYVLKKWKEAGNV